MVTRALAKYVKLHGESVAGRLVRMVCPVSVRKDEQGDSLGNRISFLPVTLPLDAEDPVEHLKAIAPPHRHYEERESGRISGHRGKLAGRRSAPAQALFWWGIPLVPLPAPLLNLICTNVPGSPAPLYSVGKRMLASYPHVPTGYELGVGVAVQSYNGTMCFGLTADAVVAPDVGRLRDFIRASWDELCRAAGVRQTPHQPEITGKRPCTQDRSRESGPRRSAETGCRPVIARAPASLPAEPAPVPQSAPPAPQPSPSGSRAGRPVVAPAPRFGARPVGVCATIRGARPVGVCATIRGARPAASARPRTRAGRPVAAPAPASVARPAGVCATIRAARAAANARPGTRAGRPVAAPAPAPAPAPAVRGAGAVQQSAPPAPELETAEVPPPLAHVNIA